MAQPKIELSLEQIASLLKQLKPKELDTLSLLLDEKTEKKILKRSQEIKNGKVKPIRLSKSKVFQDIDK